ncbi:thrombospondin type 3 repeat-containing protein [Nitrosopumilus sp. SJ]|nr:thrombospondin type 3 repeat-containing protein [Nitrosopumilus sp. SJ]
MKLMLVLLTVSLTVSFLAWNGTVSFADFDNDGVIDSIDNCPTDSNFDQADFDSDNLGDVCDLDDDNDGFNDDVDLFDTDPSDWADSDFDFIGDNKDTDDDNDGVSDSLDQFDTDPIDWADFDFDGIGSNQDPDDDNDGILDIDDYVPVLPSESLATKYFQDIRTCADMNDGTLRLVCYSEFFGRLAESEKNNADALELSIALSKMGTMDDCHFVSHEIGHVAYEETGDVSKSLQGMDGTMCRGGYFHGVLASYFHNIGELDKPFPNSYKTICDDLIGSSNYQDCVHGLGHGFVHYFGDDLDSSLASCHELSLYQNILCVKGVMMQYTDNVLTRDGLSEETISNLCNSEHLAKNDYLECSMSTGTTLAFFTNHDFQKGQELCDVIVDDVSRNYCVEGLRLEIQDSEKYEVSPLTEDIREKYQPQWIGDNIVDIRTPSTISNFNYQSEIGMITFSFDKPEYVILLIPNNLLLPENYAVSVNGILINDLVVEPNFMGEDVVMIQFVPTSSGTAMIAPVS